MSGTRVVQGFSTSVNTTDKPLKDSCLLRVCNLFRHKSRSRLARCQPYPPLPNKTRCLPKTANQVCWAGCAEPVLTALIGHAAGVADDLSVVYAAGFLHASLGALQADSEAGMCVFCFTSSLLAANRSRMAKAAIWKCCVARLLCRTRLIDTCYARTSGCFSNLFSCVRCRGDPGDRDAAPAAGKGLQPPIRERSNPQPPCLVS